jgi:thiol:disulfide interchange protein DsbC
MKKTILLLSLALATSFSVSASVEKTTANLKKLIRQQLSIKLKKRQLVEFMKLSWGKTLLIQM